MNLKDFTIVIAAMTSICFCQDSIKLDDTDDSLEYLVNFQLSNASTSYTSCTGVFIRRNYILTGANCVMKRNNADFTILSGVSNVRFPEQGEVHTPLKYHVHPQFNIAVIEIENTNRHVSPRWLGKINTKRFCKMVGWEGFNIASTDDNPLRMYSLIIDNTTVCESEKFYCTGQSFLTTNSSYCGGLEGAPLFCENDDSVSGIVVTDNFCKYRTGFIGGSFISVDDFQDWINEVTNGIDSLSFSFALLLTALAFIF